MNCYGIIYKATNKVNGKVYIGKTVQKLNNRKRKHFYCAEKGMKNIFYNSIRKHGKDNFYFEQIDYAQNREELSEKESYWINYYRSYIGFEDCNGYNMSLGGEGQTGYKFTEEQLLKRTGENNQWYGKKRPEHSEFLKGRFTGEKHPMYGKKFPSPEKVSKPILVLDKDGRIVKRFPTTGDLIKDKEWKKSFPKPNGNAYIINCLKQGLSFHGYKLIYEKDLEVL